MSRKPITLTHPWLIIWRDRLVSALPAVAIIALGIWAALHFVDPAPPMRIVMATGTDDSQYSDFARHYQSILAADGVQLVLQGSGGAAENLRKLRNEDDESRIAFLQDGLADSTPGATPDSPDSPDSASVKLVSLGSVSYEPIWLFYRGKRLRSRLTELGGMRIAVGEAGSGTNVFAMRLLTASGIGPGNATLLKVTHAQAQQMLMHAQVDAAFFIGTPDSSLIRTLARQPQVHIMNMDQSQAYSRLFPYLHTLVLPHGSMDLAHDTPGQDLHLLATTTTVVVTEDLHPALVALLMKAMSKTHAAPGLLNDAREFPAPKDSDFPLSKEAERFYKSGPPFLQRYLPFWLATLVDRAALAILPVLAILVPVVRTAPALYFWRIRRRIYRWYGELKYIEIQAGQQHPDAEKAILLRQVDVIEEKVKLAALPLAFTEHVYVLREHMDLVRRKMQLGTAIQAAPAG